MLKFLRDPAVQTVVAVCGLAIAVAALFAAESSWSSILNIFHSGTGDINVKIK